VSLTKQVCEKIITFKDLIKDVFLFLDNDKAGDEATETIVATLIREKINVGSYNEIYKDEKDLSEFWSKPPAPDKFKP
jgi:DNA primase